MIGSRFTPALFSGVIAFHPRLASAAESAEAGGASPFSGDLGNALWTLVTFALVVFVLGKFAWRPILEGLLKRERFIRESLESARRDREEAETRLKEYEEQIRNARDEAMALVEEGRRNAEAVRRRIEDDARRNAQEVLDRARREIGIARDSALSELYKESADLAVGLAAGVLQRELTDADHKRLIRDALQQVHDRGMTPN